MSTLPLRSVKKAPASTVGDIAEAMIEIFNHNKGIEKIGIRPGEKMHEYLVSREELFRTEDLDSYFRIAPEVPGMDYRKYYYEGVKKANSIPKEGYTSANTERLSREQTKELILSLDEIQQALRELKQA